MHPDRSDRVTPSGAAATLTAAAGVIHLLAARSHAELSVLLAVSFVLVGTAQLATLLAARRWPERTDEAVVFLNLAAIGAWAVSRTIGLPLVGLGVEPVGIADVTTVALQVSAVGLLVVPTGVVAAIRGVVASLAVMASLGAVAVAAPSVGHAHGDDGHGGDGHGDHHGEAPSAAAVVQLGPGDFEGGDTDLSQSDVAAEMRALMTGQRQPVIRTSDGRLLGTAHDHESLAEIIAGRDRATAGSSPVTDDGHTHQPGDADHGH